MYILKHSPLSSMFYKISLVWQWLWRKVTKAEVPALLYSRSAPTRGVEATKLAMSAHWDLKSDYRLWSWSNCHVICVRDNWWPSSQAVVFFQLLLVSEWTFTLPVWLLQNKVVRYTSGSHFWNSGGGKLVVLVLGFGNISHVSALVLLIQSFSAKIIIIILLILTANIVN